MTRTANSYFSDDGLLLNTFIYFISVAGIARSSQLSSPCQGRRFEPFHHRSPLLLLSRAGRWSAPTFQPSPHWEARHQGQQEKMDILDENDIQTSISSIRMQENLDYFRFLEKFPVVVITKISPHIPAAE
jgi:hypothetical protein